MSLFSLFVDFTDLLIQAKWNPRAADLPVDNVKNAHFLVLISENFLEARAALSRSGITNLSTQSPVKVDVSSVSAPPSTSIPSGLFCTENTISCVSSILQTFKFVSLMKM